MDDRVFDYHHVQDSPSWVVALVSLVAILLFSLTITLARTDQAPAWLLLIAVMLIAAFYLTVLSATRLTTRVSSTTLELVWRLGMALKDSRSNGNR